MKETYLAVAGRIRRELDQIQEVAHRAQTIWAEAGAPKEGDYHLDAVALNLHGFYAGLEHIFETIASRVDQTVPDWASWHQELLDPMNTNLPRIRLTVLSDGTRRKLDPYRGFRHVVRNVYTFDLDPEQMELLMRRLPEITKQVDCDLRTFADTLEHIAADESIAEDND